MLTEGNETGGATPDLTDQFIGPREAVLSSSARPTDQFIGPREAVLPSFARLSITSRAHDEQSTDSSLSSSNDYFDACSLLEEHNYEVTFVPRGLESHEDVNDDIFHAILCVLPTQEQYLTPGLEPGCTFDTIMESFRDFLAANTLVGGHWNYRTLLIVHKNRLYKSQLHVLTMKCIKYTYQGISYKEADKWRRTRLCFQSGSPKDFAKSKYETKEKNRQLLKSRTTDKIAYVKGKNCGSYRAKNVRNLLKKAKYQAGNIFSLDVDKLESSMIVFEKMASIYMLLYKDSSFVRVLTIFTTAYSGSIFYDIIKKLVCKYKTLPVMQLTLVEIKGMLMDVITKWDSAKLNTHLSSFVALASTFISSVMCPSIQAHFSMETFDIIKQYMATLFGGKDLFGCIIGAALYIANAVEVFVRTGSLAGFLVTESLSDELTEEFNSLVENHKLYKNGDNEFVGGSSHHVFLKQLADFIDKCKETMPALTGFQRKTLTDHLKIAEAMHVETKAVELHRSTRKSPFSFLLVSATGTSKSHIMKILTTLVLKANGYESSKDYLYYLNDKDKFVSSWKNYCTAILVDDSANARTTDDGFDLANFVLKAVNNQPHNLQGAAIEDKGSQFNRAAVLALSSNNPHQNYQETSHFASTQERRVQYKILVEVIETCRKADANGVLSSIIDYDKVIALGMDPVFPDAWYFTVYETVVQDLPIAIKTEFAEAIPSVRDNLWKWVIVEDEGQALNKVGIRRLEKFMVKTSKRHFARQQDVVTTDEALDKAELCPSCNIFAGSCGCIPPDSQSPYLEEPEESDTGSTHSEPEAESVHSDSEPEDEVRTLQTEHTKSDTPTIESLMSVDTEVNSARLMSARPPHMRPREPVDSDLRNENMVDHLEELQARHEAEDGFIPYVNSVRRLNDLDTASYRTAYMHDYERRSPGRGFGRGRGRRPARGRGRGRNATQRQDQMRYQNGRDVTYMKKGIEFLRKMQDKTITDKLMHTATMIRLGKTTTMEAVKVFADYFDDVICHLIVIFIKRMSKFLTSNVKTGVDMISRHVEGTPVGTYLHSRTNIAQVLGVLDLISPGVNIVSIILALRKGHKRPVLALALMAAYKYWISHDKPFTTFYLFILKFWRKIPKMPDVMDVVKNAIRTSAEAISENALVYKTANPCVLRDEIALSAAGMYAMGYLLPQLYTKLSELYVTEAIGPQMGMDLDEHHVKVLDEEAAIVHNDRTNRILDYPLTTIPSRLSDLMNTVRKNLFYCSSSLTREYVMGLGLVSNIIHLPQHFVRANMGATLTFIRKPIMENGPANTKFSAMIDSANVYFVPNSDSALIKVSNTGGLRDITRFISAKPVRDQCAGKMLYRNAQGKEVVILTSNVYYSDNTVIDHNTNTIVKGYSYKADNFAGLCGAPLMDQSRRHSHIMGTHSGGNGNIERDGVANYLDVNALMAGISFLTEGAPIVNQAGFNLVTDGVDHFVPGCHHKSVLLDRPDLKNLRVLGRLDTRTKVINRVEYTMIKDDLQAILKHKLEFGPPPLFGPSGDDKKFASKQMYDKFLQAPQVLPPALVKVAAKDYEKQLFSVLNKDPERWRKEIRPLTRTETVQGEDGVSFVNSLNMSTSAGKHWSGTKADHAEQINGKWFFTEKILREYDKRWEKLSRLQRSWECVYALPKVEPTLQERIDLGKTRTFFATDTCTQMIIRRLLLRMTRLMCTQSASSECAVGLNAHATRWEDCLKFLNLLDGKGFIALDFKNFDLGMAVQVLEAAIDITIKVAKWSGNYSQEEMNALYSLKVELIDNIVDVNGDLVQMIGAILSGVNITSIIGSICNSIYIRIAVFSILDFEGAYKKFWETHTFNDIVKMLTYGDDLIGKVHKAYPQINVQSIIDALAKFGIKATNAKKDNSIVRYVKLGDLEFLKRTFRYDYDFKTYVAPLNEASIIKSLSCVLPPKSASLDEIVASNIDTALFEYKFHGRKKFNYMRKVLIGLAQKHDIEHMVVFKDLTFDDMLEEWKTKYSRVITADTKSGIVAVRQWVAKRILELTTK